MGVVIGVIKRVHSQDEKQEKREYEWKWEKKQERREREITRRGKKTGDSRDWVRDRYWETKFLKLRKKVAISNA